MQKAWVLFIQKQKKKCFFEATRPNDFETLIKKLKKASI